LNTQTIVNSSQSDYLSSYVGTVSLIGGVSTYAGQTYRANMVSASAVLQPGTFTFSIYDPASRINYLLPTQTVGNSACSGASCGQMNLQNPNSADSLTINGANNYLGVQNRSGTNNWGAVATITPALGYVAPAFVPPAFVPPGMPVDMPMFFLPMRPMPPLLPGAPAPFDPNAAAPAPKPFDVRPGGAAFIASTIQNSTNFVFFAPAQSAASVNVVMAPDANALGGSKTIAGMQAFNRDALIPKPDTGMVNVLLKVMINGEPTTLASSSPAQGFKFTVPEALLPSSIVSNTATLTASPTTGSMVERAVQSDGSPLPTWLKYDPETNTFSADQIPAGAKPVEIKIQSIRNGQVLEESPPIVIDTK
jgi:hypothetical protein